MLEKALIILKPSAVQRGLIGGIINRFEGKGLMLAGLGMNLLSGELFDYDLNLISSLYANDEN